MKPEWNDAPLWANYLAMDGEGDWYWHENKPYVSSWNKCWESSGRTIHAASTEWKNTVESRHET